jgi:hypothetical protein
MNLVVDDDGKIKRSTDLRSDAGVAWAKVGLRVHLEKRIS